MKKIILPLLGAGLTHEAVFVQLRAMYQPDVSDREIRDIVIWAAKKNPQPCGYPRKTGNFSASFSPQLPTIERVTEEQAIRNAEEWLRDFRCDECDLWHVSPWRPLEDWRVDALMLFAALYDKNDFLNVVTDFTIERQNDGKQKAKPKGAGKSLLRDNWMRAIRDNGVPQSAMQILQAFGFACSKAMICRLISNCRCGRCCRCRLLRSSTALAEVLTHG